MNKPDRSTFTPLDFAEWNSTGSLEIQPKFQRREVWSTSKKGYLIDTILSGMPVPPIFMRVTQSPDRKRIIREIVDGQQRIKAVLDFIEGKFSLSKLYAQKHSGPKFDKLPEHKQDTIRQYSFICEVFHGITDAEVLEIFSRVNTYSVPLNQQELLNGKYFGYFKSTASILAYEHLEFWRKHKIFNEIAIARMSEVELTSELMAFLLKGTQHKKDTLESFYSDYDETFGEVDKIQKRFRSTIDSISQILNDDLKITEFRRPAFFYSLFSVIAKRLFDDKKTFSANERQRIKDKIIKISDAINSIKSGNPVPGFSQSFINACLKSTDKLNERTTRLDVIHKYLFS